jgi:hypothetical protein
LSITYNGKQYQFGQEKSKLSAELIVLNPRFWHRLAMFSALGFAEAYMYKDIEVDDLYTLLLVFLID